MRIALLHSTNPGRKVALNKDLNGGLGTADDYGRSAGGRLLTWLKRRHVSLPVISIAHIQAILKRQGHVVAYFEDELPEESFDLALILGSMVDLTNENKLARRLRRRTPHMRIGVFGPYPARFPQQFPAMDFVIGGEAEAFFLENDAARLLDAEGLVPNDATLDLDELPPPDYDGFPIHRYGYAPMLPKRPYLPLIASKGCPYSCRFYCSYGEYQGPRIRQRSAAKVYGDMRHLAAACGVRSVQFRDPLFGMRRECVLDLCQRLIERPLGIEWGIETRADLLTPALLDRMHAAGLRSVNLGVETRDAGIAKANRRKLVAEDHQGLILEHARRIGVRINAFFMFGFEGDTPQTMRATADFALELNPTAARFSVSTPYPGTGFYAQLQREGRLAHADVERHTQFSLVHRHGSLGADQVRKALVRAYLRFYLRPGYMLRTACAVWRANSRLFADNRGELLPAVPLREPQVAQASLPTVAALGRRVEATLLRSDFERFVRVMESHWPTADDESADTAQLERVARRARQLRKAVESASATMPDRHAAEARERLSRLAGQARSLVRRRRRKGRARPVGVG